MWTSRTFTIIGGIVLGLVAIGREGAIPDVVAVGIALVCLLTLVREAWISAKWIREPIWVRLAIPTLLLLAAGLLFWVPSVLDAPHDATIAILLVSLLLQHRIVLLTFRASEGWGRSDPGPSASTSTPITLPAPVHDRIRELGLPDPREHASGSEFVEIGAVGLLQPMVLTNTYTLKSLAPESITALVAHTLAAFRTWIRGTQLILVPLAATAYIAACVGLGAEPNVLGVLAWMVLVVSFHESQILFRADRIAARATGPEAFREAIARIVGEECAAHVAFGRCGFYGPFVLRPAVSVRYAKQGARDPAALAGHALGWTLSIALVVGAPVAGHLGNAEGWLGSLLFEAAPGAFLLLVGIVRTMRFRAVLSGNLASLGSRDPGPPIFLGALAVALVGITAVLRWTELGTVDPDPWILGFVATTSLFALEWNRTVASFPGRRIVPRPWLEFVLLTVSRGRARSALESMDQWPPAWHVDPWAIVTRAMALQFVGDLHQAKGILEELIAREPRFAPALGMRLANSHLLGDLAKAEELLPTVRTRCARSAELQVTCGLIALEIGDLDGAERDFARARAAEPGNTALWAGSLLVRLERGESASAVEEELRRCVRWAPRDRTTCLALARWHLARGDREEAAQVFAGIHTRIDEEKRAPAHGWIERWQTRWEVPKH